MIKTKTMFLKAILHDMSFLSEDQTKESFFKRIAVFLSPLDEKYKLIEKAYTAAENAFPFENRREDGTRYFIHLRATALILIEYVGIQNYILIIAALLHDIVEDTHWTIEMVKAEFGEEVAKLVSYLTKPSAEEFPEKTKEERVESYHIRFKEAPLGFHLIKMTDRFHNLITLWYSSPGKIIRKIKETERYYLSYAKEHRILYHETMEAIKSLRLYLKQLKTLKQQAS